MSQYKVTTAYTYNINIIDYKWTTSATPPPPQSKPFSKVSITLELGHQLIRDEATPADKAAANKIWYSSLFFYGALTLAFNWSINPMGGTHKINNSKSKATVRKKNVACFKVY